VRATSSTFHTAATADCCRLLERHPEMLAYFAPLAPTARVVTDANCACGGGTCRSLKALAREYLNREIQSGEHSPAEDAIAAMDLFRLKWSEWEGSLKEFKGGGSGKKVKASAVRQVL
jgi:hypothetical protein